MENWKGTAGVQSIHNNSKVIKKCREVEVSAFDLDPPPHSLPTSPTSPTLSAFEGGKRHDVSVNRGSNVKQLLVGITSLFLVGIETTEYTCLVVSAHLSCSLHTSHLAIKSPHNNGYRTTTLLARGPDCSSHWWHSWYVSTTQAECSVGD